MDDSKLGWALCSFCTIPWPSWLDLFKCAKCGALYRGEQPPEACPECRGPDFAFDRRLKPSELEGILCDPCAQALEAAVRVAGVGGVGFRCAECGTVGTLLEHSRVARQARIGHPAPEPLPVLVGLDGSCPRCRELGLPPGHPGGVEAVGKIMDFMRYRRSLKSSEIPPPSTGLVTADTRVVGDLTFKRPVGESFASFLFFYLTQEFEEAWLAREMKAKPEERHIVAQWFIDWEAWKSSPSGKPKMEDGKLKMTVSGAGQSLLAMAFDLFCLRQAGKLSDPRMRRLRDHDNFQGVRYENAVAATVLRARCTIDWLSDKAEAEHCEFIATHTPSNERWGVEAKSRHRPGVLNFPGVAEDAKVVKGDVSQLLGKARKQAPAGIPFAIFIDLNTLPGHATPLDQKVWWAGFKEGLDWFEGSSAENPSVETVLLLTNFAYHFAPEAAAPGTEMTFGCPMHAKHLPKSRDSLTDIMISTKFYGHVPDDPPRR